MVVSNLQIKHKMRDQKIEFHNDEISNFSQRQKAGKLWKSSLIWPNPTPNIPFFHYLTLLGTKKGFIVSKSSLNQEFRSKVHSHIQSARVLLKAKKAISCSKNGWKFRLKKLLQKSHYYFCSNPTMK